MNAETEEVEIVMVTGDREKLKSDEKKLIEMLDELRDSFKGVEKEMNDVGADYYLYDRVHFLKDTESDGTTDIRSEDLETLRTLMIQMLLFNQQIFFKPAVFF